MWGSLSASFLSFRPETVPFRWGGSHLEGKTSFPNGQKHVFRIATNVSNCWNDLQKRIQKVKGCFRMCSGPAFCFSLEWFLGPPSRFWDPKTLEGHVLPKHNGSYITCIQILASKVLRRHEPLPASEWTLGRHSIPSLVSLTCFFSLGMHHDVPDVSDVTHQLPAIYIYI